MDDSEKKEIDPASIKRACRAAGDRHVVILEAEMDDKSLRHAFALANRLRIAGNCLTGEMRKRCAQLLRTKAYRSLKKEYGKIKQKLNGLKPDDPSCNEIEKQLKGICREMKAMQETYEVTHEKARLLMQELYPRYQTGSIFSRSRMEDIWKGVEKILYGNGEELHFRKKGNLPVIQAREIERGITLKADSGTLVCNLGNECKPVGKFRLKRPDVEDIFLAGEVAHIIHYLENADAIDAEAVALYEREKKTMDTFRPCYVSLKCEVVRGKLRVFAHITVEGRALPKLKLDKETGDLVPRHDFSRTGRIGGDIGPQTVAIATEDAISLDNLAERNGESSKQYEARKARLLDRMDSKRRANNPENYNADGTIKERQDRKPWKNSKSYLKCKDKLTELERATKLSRRYANQEMANDIREMGDEFITEPPNAKAMQKKAKKSRVVKDKDGKEKNTSRKRLGKSIYHRAPGGFQADLKKKFGSGYHEVDKMYRASQFDVTSGEYVKKELSDRIYALADGTMVQRDMYSAWLLRNANWDYTHPDYAKCREGFSEFLRRQAEAVNEIAHSGRMICNSGITDDTVFVA